MVKRTFLVYALVELAVLGGLTWAIGLGWTLLVLLATSAVGVVMAGSQAKRQLLRLRQTQTNPQGAAADGMLVALGTVLVFIPGLVTTALGTLMLLPPTRSAVRPVAAMLLTRSLLGQVRVMKVGHVPGGHGDYIDGEVIDEQVSAPVHDANIVRYYGA